MTEKPKENLKYSVLEVKEDPKLTVILMEGISNTFTFNDIALAIIALKKQRTALQAEIGVHEATKVNVLKSNPEVKDMDEKTLIAAYLYKKSSAIVSEGLKTLQSIEDQLTEYSQELVDIAAQTGLQTEIKIDGNSEIYTAPLTEKLNA